MVHSQIVHETREYIPDPDEDIIEEVPSATKPVVIADTASERNIVLFRIYQLTWFVLGIIETLLLFRFVFKMIGANTFSGFTDFIYSLSDPLTAPFVNILPSTTSNASVMEWSTLIAIIVYLVIAYGIFELLGLWTPLQRQQKHIHKRTRYAL